MSTLLDYTNLSWGTDWVLYFEHQVCKEEMNAVWDSYAIDFLVWTVDRLSGTTICWVQSESATCRNFIRGMFTAPAWVGSTTGNEEFRAWYGMGRRDCYLYKGRYQERAPTGDFAGRLVCEEITEACRELDQ